MATAQTTISISGVPVTAIASELVDYFERTLCSRGVVFACEIFTSHDTWKSRGTGRIQFETLSAADELLRRHASGRLEPFQNSHLLLSRASRDIIARAADPLNRLAGVRLQAGLLSRVREMSVLETWEEVLMELMPEREKLELFFDHKDGIRYKMEIIFGDISESFLCYVGKERESAILLKMRFAPRIYRKFSGPNVKPGFKHDRYHFCKENLQFRWVRSVDFTSSCSIGKSFCFCLQLQRESWKLENAIKKFPLHQSLGNLITVEGQENFCFSEFPPMISNHRDRYPPLAYEIFFHLNYLVHTQKISLAQINAKLFDRLSRLEERTADHILNKLRRNISVCFDPLQFIELNSRKIRRHQKNSKIRTYRALVTPSRVYLVGPEIQATNYVICHFSSRASDFLRVSFVDEDWSKLSSEAISTVIHSNLFSEPYLTSIHGRISSFLRNGISIAEKKFEFLAFSASQLRSNSVWMFASDENLSAEQIRNWMGNFQQIRSVSKCAARMGQLFSTSIQTFHVPIEDTETISDIESSSDGIRYCFSDGIGKISPSLAAEVSVKCGIAKTPSAFQIRYGGYKGVVVVDSKSEKKLSLRRSMLKFESKNTMLSITRWSEITPCYLNREIISLFSTLGVRDEAFLDLQSRNIRDLDQMLGNRETAMRILHRVEGSDVKTSMKMMNHGYHPRSEPYLSMILRSRRESQMGEIKSRSRIFVPRGRVLFGCLDEARVLDYGQIYVRVRMTSVEMRDDTRLREIDDETAVVVGRVVVTKNPCLHPGDVRVLDAVYDPALEDTGIVDCLVFPQKGERPHPSECSGGDLDGDQYFVSWDEHLIPPTTDEPMDYIPRRPRIMDHDVTLEIMQEIQSFFLDYMINDTLGAISTAHLIHGDRHPMKARSPGCQQLAKLHSMSVDFAKSGSPAEMPNILKPREYPDFMERVDRPMYPSQSILGKLYTAMSSKPCTDNLAVLSVNVDFDLIVNGFESFLPAAITHRDLYSEKLRDLMDYFGAASEDEILTGNIRKKLTNWTTDRRQQVEVKEKILFGVTALQEEAAGWLREYRADDQAKMASAWYYVTYHADYYVREKTFLSFPWVACDILLDIKTQKRLQRL